MKWTAYAKPVNPLGLDFGKYNRPMLRQVCEPPSLDRREDESLER